MAVKELAGIKLGEVFKPNLELKTLFYGYLLLFIVFLFLPWYIPTMIFAFQLDVVVIATIAVLIFIVIAIIWIRLYYERCSYRLTQTEMEWKRGVWFRRMGIVPYNRITNVDIVQGPFQRWLGIASLKIQTAGYSAPSPGTSEIRIEGVKQHEELRELIMQFVRNQKSVGVVGTFQEEKPTDVSMLGELRRIRELLELSQIQRK